MQRVLPGAEPATGLSHQHGQLGLGAGCADVLEDDVSPAVALRELHFRGAGAASRLPDEHHDRPDRRAGYVTQPDRRSLTSTNISRNPDSRSRGTSQEHWVHLRTTNPIESTFSTVRHRTKVTKVTKGPGSKAAGLAMAFKLIEAAQHRWRAVNAPHLVALVRVGAKFDKGVLVERDTPAVTEEAA